MKIQLDFPGCMRGLKAVITQTRHLRVLVESFGSHLQALKCREKKAGWGNLLPAFGVLQLQ